ncbi:MAG: phage baseplate protein [Fusobacteriaceae bacterium]|jgi:phage baseplate assembly protein gpV|nr:phage baseplate protein [Fusobacteriaceae bacterium]
MKQLRGGPGTIQDFDAATYTARVKLEEDEDMITDFLPVLSPVVFGNRITGPMKPGTPVFVIFAGDGNDQADRGMIVGGYFTTENTPAAVKDHFVFDFGGSKLDIDEGGTITLTASNFVISGNMTQNGVYTNNGTDVTHHDHGGITPGGAKTDPMQ